MTEYIEKLKREVTEAYDGNEFYKPDEKVVTGIKYAIDELHSRGIIVQDGFVSVPLETINSLLDAHKTSSVDWDAMRKLEIIVATAKKED